MQEEGKYKKLKLPILHKIWSSLLNKLGPFRNEPAFLMIISFIYPH